METKQTTAKVISRRRFLFMSAPGVGFCLGQFCRRFWAGVKLVEMRFVGTEYQHLAVVAQLGHNDRSRRYQAEARHYRLQPAPERARSSGGAVDEQAMQGEDFGVEGV
jgi:hypothetical protein